MTIALCGLVGAILPFLFFGMPDRAYVAATTLKVEAASDADVNAAISRLRSKASLDNLVRALNLNQAGDFSAGRQGFFQVFLDIVSGGGLTVAEAEAELRTRLLRATSIAYASGELAIRAEASVSDEAARVTATLATMFGQQLAGVAETAANPALTGMRQALERADAALSGFQTQAGQAKLAEMRRFSADAQQLASEQADAEAEFRSVHEKAAQAASMKWADVLGKALPDSLEFTGLEYNRQRYVEAKLTVDQMSSDLGPLHPRLQAAQAAADAVRKDIEETLKRLSISLRQQEGVAAKNLADVKTRSDALIARQDIAEGASKLVALQAAVEEARDNYLQAQGRTRQEPAAAAKVRVLKPLATDTTGWSWFDYLPLVAAGAFAGGVVGLASNAAGQRRPQVEAQPAEAAEPIDLDPAIQMTDAEWANDDVLATGWEDEDLLEPRTYEAEAVAAGEFYAEIDDVRAYHADNEDAGTWGADRWAADPADEHDGYDHDFELPEAANDRPLSELIRELLIANRRPHDADGVPSLVAAAIDSRAGRQDGIADDTYRLPVHDARTAEEFQELRRDMAELRERVQFYSERRTASRR